MFIYTNSFQVTIKTNLLYFVVYTKYVLPGTSPLNLEEASLARGSRHVLLLPCGY